MFASHTRQLKTLIQCDVCFKFFPNAATLAKHQAAEHQGEDRPAPRAGAFRGSPSARRRPEPNWFIPVSQRPHLSAVCPRRPGAAAHCPYCTAALGGEEELQEHIGSQHQSGEAPGCPLCSALCRSHTELQEHLMSAHVEQESGEEPPAAARTVGIQKTRFVRNHVCGEKGACPESADRVRVQSSFCLQVMSSTGSGEAGSAACEAGPASLSETPTVNTVEVNMYELLNNSVAFNAQDKPPHPGSEV